MSVSRILPGAWRLYGAAVAVSILYVTAGWVAYRLIPRRLNLRPAPAMPAWNVSDGRLILAKPGSILVASLATYEDELFAYMMLQHVRQAAARANRGVYLSYSGAVGELKYTLEAVLPNDLMSAPISVQELGKGEFARSASWSFVTSERLRQIQLQTRILMAAYNLPVRRRLESIPRAELQAYLERFVRFKSVTDPRIRRKIAPVPRALSTDQAKTLASDIITVAAFYSLPLDAFLGIGAMENNYMDVPGDLEHAVWKRRAEKGDIVLKRDRNRVFVLNPSAGVWQITRETLRYAHKLYRKDQRDYAILPARLRPPAALDPDDTRPEVLTTYAGLIFRDLLDRFEGDVPRAVGAYNGGFLNPNRKYAEGVGYVARYARAVVETAATLGNRPAAGMLFVSAAP